MSGTPGPKEAYEMRCDFMASELMAPTIGCMGLAKKHFWAGENSKDPVIKDITNTSERGNAAETVQHPLMLKQL